MTRKIKSPCPLGFAVCLSKNSSTRQKSQLDVDLLLEEVQTEGPVDQDIGDGIEQRGKLVAEDAAIACVVEELVDAGVAQQIIDAEGYEQQV